MPRSPSPFLFLMALALVAGCDKASAPAATPAAPSAETQSASRSKAPSPSHPDSPEEARARAAAQALGPGTCEQDVPALRVLPLQQRLGVDPHFDRMLVHRTAYAACLVALVRDRTPIADPVEGSARGFAAYDQGDLAYDLLVELRHVEYGECIPAAAVQRERRESLYEWLDDRNHRRQAHRCLGKTLGL